MDGANEGPRHPHNFHLLVLGVDEEAVGKLSELCSVTLSLPDFFLFVNDKIVVMIAVNKTGAHPEQRGAERDLVRGNTRGHLPALRSINSSRRYV